MGSKNSYRNNPEVRARAVQRATEYARKAEKDPLRKRRILLSKRVYSLREYIDAHLDRISKLEIRLVKAVDELNRVKQEIRKKPLA